MFVDAITLAAVADEWRKMLIGARIDTIIQPTEHALAIQCYGRALGCDDVLYDADADQVGDLPTWDW